MLHPDQCPTMSIVRAAAQHLREHGQIRLQQGPWHCRGALTCSCSDSDDDLTRCASSRQRSEKLSASSDGRSAPSDASLMADARLRSDSDSGSRRSALDPPVRQPHRCRRNPARRPTLDDIKKVAQMMDKVLSALLHV